MASLSSPAGRAWPSAALSRLVLLALYLLAPARAATVTVGGVTYIITLSPPSTVAQVQGSLTNAPWFNDPALAESLAVGTKDTFGLVNEVNARRKLLGDGMGSVGPHARAFTGNNLGPIFLTKKAGVLTFIAFNQANGQVFSFGATTGSWVFALYTAPPDPIEEWRSYNPFTGSVLWVPQVGLDCRATCANIFMLAVSASKPTEAMPNPPLLCAAIGALLNDPTLTVPASLADDPYRFYLSEGYTRPTAANAAAGRPAEVDPSGCSSYLERTAPNAQNFLCGCMPPRKSVNGTPKKPWRWVPASTDNCNSDTFQGYMAPFICRVRATGLIGHLNTQNCGFPSADELADCAFGQYNKQPASEFPAALNMPAAKPDFPDCVYATRIGVQGSTQDVAGWNSVDKLCITSSFSYFVYRWSKEGPRP